MISDNDEDIVVHSASFDTKYKKQKMSNTYMSSLEFSQSDEFNSTEYNNLVDSDNNASNECYNLANSNNDTVTDKDNNLINEKSSNLPNKPTNILNLPNLKAIKLVSITKHSGRSWIWSYYQRYEPVLPYRTIVSCLVEVNKNHKNELCGHIMGSVDSSTGNYIRHLATRHGITESSHKKKTKKPQSSQLKIDQIIYSNPEHKRRKDQKFVELLIKDQQPISIQNDEGLKNFIAEFDLFIYSAINTITNNLILTDNLELREVNYKDDISVFDDTNLNEDQTDNIKVKTALYNAINYYWEVPLKEGMLAALLDPRCKALSFTSESLKSRTYDSLQEVYKQHQNQTNISHIKQPLPSTSKLLASIFRSNNAQIDEVYDYIGIP
ncbi:12796_t:CDS:2 [Racocetra fulgida]|uniref:12796_t:CDS:1 n=1 Tax=Racocetra fulgida TaxID=60492 RepID=A0A9N9B893_9GLOM|nr:12796_t:CDS:2 [Racocetra fulgida]